MKDALIEDYTLDMVVDMTDKDIDDIFDELKISSVKRPRFRNAVKRLKQNNGKFYQSQSPSQHQTRTNDNRIFDMAKPREKHLEITIKIQIQRKILISVTQK